MEIHFAPIQGHTDTIYREAFRKFFGGLDSFYTPFIRVERGAIRNKDLRELENGVNEQNLVPQIMAGNAQELRLLVERVAEYGYRHIDINMGCPFPMITGAGKGAGILAKPEKVKEVLDCIKEFSGLEFSLKVRLGYESCSNLFELIPYLNTLPLRHLTVHPRTAKQQYKGEVHIDEFAKIYECSTLPLIYNGDLKSVADIARIVSDFPNLKGIMIGRGLLENPMLAENYLFGDEVQSADFKQRVVKFHGELLERYSGVLQGEHQILKRMQSLWEYLRNPNGDERILKKLKKCTSMPKYLGMVAEYLK
ncbi:MAG: tRNA-dihydrouridine synthase family protein [Marinifilaceae bacterium]|nr:tRNA-dihydrouridine synthase family protein [Marinifilaceae bacterium]